MTESEQQDMELLIERNTILQQQYKDVNEFKIKLLEENAQLKELLKECRKIMLIEKDFASCHFEKDKLGKLCEQITEVLGDK